MRDGQDVAEPILGTFFAASRDVDTDFLRIVGGTTNSPGARFSAYGPDHPTLPSRAHVDGDRVQIRSLDGSLKAFDWDAINNAIGFFGSPGSTKPTVTGTTDADKINSLLSALSGLGLVTDNTI